MCRLLALIALCWPLVAAAQISSQTLAFAPVQGRNPSHMQVRKPSVVGQVIIGNVLGTGVGLVGGGIGVALVRGRCDGELLCGLDGLLIGYAVGYSFGLAGGVYLVGHRRGVREGSYLSALEGAGLGMVLFVGTGAVLGATDASFLLVPALAFPTVLAIRFFNRDLEYPDAQGSAFTVQQGRLRMSLPALHLTPDPLSLGRTAAVSVSLLRARW